MASLYSPVIPINELNRALEAIVHHCNTKKQFEYISVAYEELRRWTFMGFEAEYIEVRLAPNQRSVEIEMFLPVKVIIACRCRHRESVHDAVWNAMGKLLRQSKEKTVKEN